jgi:hypothetical protein
MARRIALRIGGLGLDYLEAPPHTNYIKPMAFSKERSRR